MVLCNDYIFRLPETSSYNKKTAIERIAVFGLNAEISERQIGS